jgi:glycerophosphoryl diester phosphodiesterase
MEIVRAAVDDWARVRAIRLAALADAPDAFSATLDEERARPPSFWQQRLGASDALTLIATRGDEDHGTAVLSVPEGSDDAWLYAVWVAPFARGLGVGDALLEEATSRARGKRRARLCLDVGDRNAHARALYARHGFRPTGRRFTLAPPREHIHEHELALPLWPHPDVIAHRGAGLLAPENTLAAIAHGAALGQRMCELDVKLSAEGTPVLMHDDTLARTTDGRGAVAAMKLAALRALDAGAWHSEAFRGARVPTLDEVADALRVAGMGVNLELKPCPGRDAETGRVVAQAVLTAWRDAAVLPLLSSFSREALAAARVAAPGVPRALLTERGDDETLRAAVALRCAAVNVAEAEITEAFATHARGMGLRVLAWTPNDVARIAALRALGVDGVITDAVDVVRPAGG